MPSKPKNSEAKICEASLKLAAQKTWSSLTLEQIAKAAKIPLAQMQKQFAGKNQIVAALIRYADEQTAASIGKTDPRAAPRDRLFAILMARFDVLQNHRKAILTILDAVRSDSSLACLILPAHWHSMRKMLELARLDSTGIQEQAVTAGLVGIYYRVLWAWRQDQTTDMAKTMAALDQALRLAGRLAEILLRKK